MEQGNRLRFVSLAKLAFRFIYRSLKKYSIIVYYSCLILVCNSSYRSTAATRMNSTSSRSHAIFTIKFTQVNMLSVHI